MFMGVFPASMHVYHMLTCYSWRSKEVPDPQETVIDSG